mgnify:CR=1 FL=1
MRLVIVAGLQGRLQQVRPRPMAQRVESALEPDDPAEQLGADAHLLPEHSLQMAVYAKAVENQLGVMPGVSLCFLSPRVQECNVDHDMIREALSGFGE